MIKQVACLGAPPVLIPFAFLLKFSQSPLHGLGLARRLGIEGTPLSNPLEASALDGRPLYQLTHPTQLVQLVISGYYTEHLSFHLFDSASHPVFLCLL